MKRKINYLLSMVILESMLSLSVVFCADFPPPPQSKEISHPSLEFNGEKQKVYTYMSKVSKDKIKKFYLENLPRYGWSRDKIYLDNVLTFVKNDRSLRIVIQDWYKGVLVAITLGNNADCSACSNYAKTDKGVIQDRDNFPHFLPRPDNVEVINTMKIGDSKIFTYKINGMNFENAANFYKQYMSSYGWKLSNEFSLNDAKMIAGGSLDNILENPQLKDYFKKVSFLYYVGKRGKVSINIIDSKQGVLTTIQYTKSR